jgi:chromosome segregation ATPase
MAQLHAQQIAFQTERGDFESQLEKLKEENDRLRTKNKELKRNNRENDFEGNRLSAENDGEGEQIAMKIQQYLARVQESSKQMAQIASECRIFDVEIEKASVQIEKNIVKSLGGLQKYVQELVRQWSHRETTRLENERLENENKYLFELTTKLQQNFKETDRILKHMQRGENRDEKYSQEIRGRMNKIEEENSERDTHARKEAITDLEGKITRLSEKVRSLEQENSTIKSIHQRTMKKLEKLEEKNRDRDEDEPIDGEGLQEERKRWL